MPCWYFEKDELLHSPSEGDGINFEAETRYREEGAGLIIELANKLGIPYDAYASAVVYFHRFYMLQSFRNFHRHVLATTCLLLASKMHDSKSTLLDLLKAVKLLLSERQFSVFGSDPQQEVIATEISLLETLKFDLDVIHPYSYLLHFNKLLEGEKETIQQLLHMSWTFVNDSLYTMLCVQYEPDLLAVAFLYLACQLTKFEVTSWQGKPADYRGKWYEHFVSDMNLDILKDICHQVLSLYSRGQSDQPLVTKTTSFAARSPSPAHTRERSISPSHSRTRRRSLSPVNRRSRDKSSARRMRHLDRESSSPSSRRRNLRRSRSRSRSRSPARRGCSGRRDRSLPRHSRSPYSSQLAEAACFLSRESFEEIQAKLRAGQVPPESTSVALPQPHQFGSYPESARPFGPPGYQPLAPHIPPAQLFVAYRYPTPHPAIPSAPGPALPPGITFPSRPPEFVPHSQILVHQPTVVGPPMVTMHPAHISMPPGLPNPDIRIFSHLPGPPPYPDLQGPIPPPPNFCGLPPDVRGPPPPNFCGPSPQDVRGPFPSENFVPFGKQLESSPQAGLSLPTQSQGPGGPGNAYPLPPSPSIGRKKTNPSQRQSNLIYTT